MIKETSFLPQVEVARTKETAQQELREKFGLKKTSDFRLALQEGKIELAEEWLAYVIDNKEKFLQYQEAWDKWLADRRRDIEKSKKSNSGQEISRRRSKEEAKRELTEKFGFADTAGFKKALESGDIEIAEKWLNHIVENKNDFPQYLATWDRWLHDRQEELKNEK